MMKQNITLLVVEDNPDDFFLLKEDIAAAKDVEAHIYHTDRLADAVSLARRHNIDVAIIDLSLPDSHGLDTFTDFQKEHPQIPTIIMTGDRDQRLAIEAVQKGAQDFLFKGESSSVVLIRTIRYAVERQQARDVLEKKVAERTAELAASYAALEKKIGELKIEHEKRLQSEEILQNIFDSISDPLIYLTEKLIVKKLNRPAIEYYQIKDETKAIDKPCHEAFRSSCSPCEECQIPSQIMNNKPLVFERKSIIMPHRIEKIVIYPLKARSGISSGAILRINDITERKMFEEQLIRHEKNASMGILVASIAHEINNPNNFISFNIPILKDYIESMMKLIDRYTANLPALELCNLPYVEFKEDLNKLLRNIENGSNRISAFVSNLKSFSQDFPTHEAILINLNEAVESAVAICRSNLKSTAKSFIKEVPDNLPDISAEPHVFEQILINLLLNASQALDKKDSQIRLRVFHDNGSADNVRVEVHDNGCGIDEDDQLKIFDPFFTTKSHEKGTGLGLFVCNTLAERINGRIEFISSPGEGSTFTLIVPIEQTVDAIRTAQDG